MLPDRYPTSIFIVLSTIKPGKADDMTLWG